jgi:peroxiredoxin
MRNILLSLLLALLLAGSVTAGEKAVDFTLKDLQGKKHTLQEYLRNGPVLISFWASWCEPCKKEIPELIKVTSAWADSGATLLCIAVDTPRSQSRLKGIVRSKKWDVPVLLDTAGKLMKRYKGSNPPLTVLINREGEVVYRHAGYAPGDEKKAAEKLAALFAPGERKQ